MQDAQTQSTPEDYLRRRALWLPEISRYDVIMQKASVSGSALPELVTAAMTTTAIEEKFETIQVVLRWKRAQGAINPIISAPWQGIMSTP
jgi:hypothetical protein